MSAMTSKSMVEFLLRHPGIEHLRLGYRLDGNTDNVLYLDEFLTDANILPNLKNLAARPYTISAFLKIRARFWATLSSLSISHGLDEKGGFKVMFRELNASKKLHKICHRELYIQSEAYVHRKKFFMGGLTQYPLFSGDWNLSSVIF
jgi:hypothetical protein